MAFVKSATPCPRCGSELIIANRIGRAEDHPQSWFIACAGGCARASIVPIDRDKDAAEQIRDYWRGV